LIDDVEAQVAGSQEDEDVDIHHFLQVRSGHVLCWLGWLLEELINGSRLQLAGPFPVLAWHALTFQLLFNDFQFMSQLFRGDLVSSLESEMEIF